MHKSIRTIQRYLKTLKALGLVIIKRRGSTSNLYILPKKLNKKVQETAQKIQEKCNAVKAALKLRKSGDSNKITTSNDNYKNHKNYKRSYKSNTFNDHTQRTYDFSKLEQALLGNACYEYENILK